MATTEHVFELIPLFVLGTLDEHESHQVIQHLPNCQLCQKELEVYEQIMVSLVTELPQTTPPPPLRGRLLQAVHPTPVKVSPYTQPAVLPLVARLFQWRWPAWAGLSLIIFLVLSTLLLWRQSNQLRAELIDTRMIVHPLYAPEDNPYTGLVVMDPEGAFGTIIVDSLPPSQTGRQYQIWLSRNDQIVSGGIVDVHENGYGARVIYAPEPLHLYERVWVTVEPEGGSVQPTGPAVLQTN